MAQGEAVADWQDKLPYVPHRQQKFARVAAKVLSYSGRELRRPRHVSVLVSAGSRPRRATSRERRRTRLQRGLEGRVSHCEGTRPGTHSRCSVLQWLPTDSLNASHTLVAPGEGRRGSRLKHPNKT